MPGPKKLRNATNGERVYNTEAVDKLLKNKADKTDEANVESNIETISDEEVPDFLHVEFENEKMKIGLDRMMDIIFANMLEKFDEFGLLGGSGGGGSKEINTVSLSITPPINGETPTIAVRKLDSRYFTGNITWNPSSSSFNGTNQYTAEFSLSPKPGYTFSGNVSIMINGEIPDVIEPQNDGSLLLSKIFPATMIELSPVAIQIPTPQENAVRPTVIDSSNGASNFEGVIIWDPPGTTYSTETSIASFELTAEEGCRWNNESLTVSFNGNNISNFVLSDDGRTLTFGCNVSISTQVPDDLIRITYNNGASRAWTDNINDLCTSGNSTSNLTLYTTSALTHTVNVAKSSVTAIEFGESSITSIPTFFGFSFNNLTRLVNLPSSITSIGNSFLQSATSFNQPLTIPNTVTSIGTNFLRSATSFNQPLTIPSSVVSIGDAFMIYCDAFYAGTNLVTFRRTYDFTNGWMALLAQPRNTPIVIPNTVTRIGGNFLFDATSFNQPLSIPNTVTSIGDYFLRGATSFNQPLTIPSSVVSIGSYFMLNTDSFTSQLTFNANANTPNDVYSLATSTSNAVPMYATGVSVNGTGATALKSRLPNRTASPFRNIR